MFSNSLLRVFPRRNSHTPTDDMVAIGAPGLWRPPADEVHISIAFTWDKEIGKQLQAEWAAFYPVVRLGGPAIDGEGDEFEPGKYLAKGITITTRGCPNSCPFCLVKNQPFREIPIKPGWIIQDNNVLAASKAHFRKMVDMLNTQPRAAIFRGGLDTTLFTSWHLEQLYRLKKAPELWFACDTDGGVKRLLRVSCFLDGCLPRRKLRCYVLCAYAGQTIGQANARLQAVWDLGFLPFAQLYQPPEKYIQHSHEWRRLAREWSRPAVMFAQHNGG